LICFESKCTRLGIKRSRPELGWVWQTYNSAGNGEPSIETQLQRNLNLILRE